MNGRKPQPDDNTSVPTRDNDYADLDILKRDIPFTEADVPIMRAPEDWPPPPNDVGSDDS